MHDCWTGLTAVVEYGWIGALGANCRGVGELETASVFIGDASGMISSSGSSTRVVSGELCPNLEGSDEGSERFVVEASISPCPHLKPMVTSAAGAIDWGGGWERSSLEGILGIFAPDVSGGVTSTS